MERVLRRERLEFRVIFLVFIEFKVSWNNILILFFGYIKDKELIGGFFYFIIYVLIMVVMCYIDMKEFVFYNYLIFISSLFFIESFVLLVFREIFLIKFGF